MNDADQTNDHTASVQQGDVMRTRGMAELKPKGACWYCNQPLDNVRRFCNKSCAEDYRTEEEAFHNLLK